MIHLKFKDPLHPYKLPKGLAEMLDNMEEETLTFTAETEEYYGKNFVMDFTIDLRPFQSGAVYRESSVENKQRTDEGEVLYNLIASCIRKIELHEIHNEKPEKMWKEASEFLNTSEMTISLDEQVSDRGMITNNSVSEIAVNTTNGTYNIGTDTIMYSEADAMEQAQGDF